MATDNTPGAITPVEFKPTVIADDRLSRFFRPLPIAVGVVLLLLLLLAAYLFMARSVQITSSPPADELEIDALLALPLGGRHLLLPGTYHIRIRKSGYYDHENDLQVGAASNQSHAFELQRLPGQVSLIAPTREFSARIDGQPVADPLSEFELSAGEHELVLDGRPWYQPYSGRIDVIGMGRSQQIEVDLLPNWSDVTVDSEPPGAQILLRDEVLAKTPATVRIVAGEQDLRLSLPGYKTWQRTLSISAGEARTLPPVELAPADAMLRVSSEPAGAAVTIDGRYRGTTPALIDVEPGKSLLVELTRAGFQSRSTRVSIAPLQEKSISLALTAELGRVVLRASPEGTVVWVNGESLGDANRELDLPARQQTFEFRLPGYATVRQRITPKPGFTQEVSVVLKTIAQAKRDALPRRITTGGGQTMVLIEPQPFTMGASRRQLGRRANEGLREVTLTRPFYMGVHEVTTSEFRQFRPAYDAGTYLGTYLNDNRYPATRITWNDAAEFCNWLSARDGLPQVYRMEGNLVVGADVSAHGYRLPTEAEWAFAARYAGREEPLVFPWGDRMPPTANTGNYADSSASRVVGNFLPGYQDGFQALAPVGSFPPNDAGLHDIGGNVAEWIHDYYGASRAALAELPPDPAGPDSGEFHVIRGSSWQNASISELRLAFRDYGNETRPDLGFRIARYVALKDFNPDED